MGWWVGVGFSLSLGIVLSQSNDRINKYLVKLPLADNYFCVFANLAFHLIFTEFIVSLSRINLFLV